MPDLAINNHVHGFARRELSALCTHAPKGSHRQDVFGLFGLDITLPPLALLVLCPQPLLQPQPSYDDKGQEGQADLRQGTCAVSQSEKRGKECAVTNGPSCRLTHLWRGRGRATKVS